MNKNINHRYVLICLMVLTVPLRRKATNFKDSDTAATATSNPKPRKGKGSNSNVETSVTVSDFGSVRTYVLLGFEDLVPFLSQVVYMIGAFFGNNVLPPALLGLVRESFARLSRDALSRYAIWGESQDLYFKYM